MRPFNLRSAKSLGGIALAFAIAAAMPLASSGVQAQQASADLAPANPSSGSPSTQRTSTTTVAALAADLKVGDIVFIRIDAKPFREVAIATGSWTNHVGIVVDVSDGEPMIGESRIPLSGTTPLSRFVARSEGGRVAVLRRKVELTPEQQGRVLAAANRRARVFYDTGFDLDSKRQFCSRYVREVMEEATGVSLGEVETFRQLLAARPETNLGFWKFWYFGNIPWERRTVTPASVMASSELKPVFDGTAKAL